MAVPGRALAREPAVVGRSEQEHKGSGACGTQRQEGQVSETGEPASPPHRTSAPRPELSTPLLPFMLGWAPLSPRELVTVATGRLGSARRWFSGGGQV